MGCQDPLAHHTITHWTIVDDMKGVSSIRKVFLASNLLCFHSDLTRNDKFTSNSRQKVRWIVSDGLPRPLSTSYHHSLTIVDDMKGVSSIRKVFLASTFLTQIYIKWMTRKVLSAVDLVLCPLLSNFSSLIQI
jgi:hypothetical protein